MGGRSTCSKIIGRSGDRPMVSSCNQLRQRFRDAMSRRAFLRAGPFGVGGLSLAHLLRFKAQGAQQARSSHKSVIMIYLCGAPAHQDMYDLKPEAPAEYRGEFKPIKTNVPGIHI